MAAALLPALLLSTTSVFGSPAYPTFDEMKGVPYANGLRHHFDPAPLLPCSTPLSRR